MTLDELPERQARQRRHFPHVQRAKMLFGELQSLPPCDFARIAEDRGLPFPGELSVRLDVILPPLKFPYRIAFTAFTDTSFLITRAGHRLPASLLVKLALLFRDWKYIQHTRPERNRFYFVSRQATEGSSCRQGRDGFGFERS